MAYVQTAVPSLEPLDLDTVKQHLRVEVSDDDALIAMLIAAARQYAETFTARSFITQSWRFTCDSWPGGLGVGVVPWGQEFDLPSNAILLEKGPVQSVQSVQYVDMGGVLQTLDTSIYVVDTTWPLCRIAPRFGRVWPPCLPQIGSVSVNFTAGFGDTASAVPAPLKQWMLLRIGALYENREEVVSGRSVSVTPLPFVDSLLQQYQIQRA